jgi:hypothetical protein
MCPVTHTPLNSGVVCWHCLAEACPARGSGRRDMLILHTGFSFTLRFLRHCVCCPSWCAGQSWVYRPVHSPLSDGMCRPSVSCDTHCLASLAGTELHVCLGGPPSTLCASADDCTSLQACLLQTFRGSCQTVPAPLVTQHSLRGQDSRFVYRTLPHPLSDTATPTQTLLEFVRVALWLMVSISIASSVAHSVVCCTSVMGADPAKSKCGCASCCQLQSGSWFYLGWWKRSISTIQVIFGEWLA